MSARRPRGSRSAQGRGPGRGRSEDERAVDLAFKAVARRERTVAELRAALERRRVEPSSIEHAVAELKAGGFLDDARYAERFAEDKRELEQWGTGRIARELARRGIAPHLIEATLREYESDAELETALILLARRFPAPAADDRERDRAWRMLVRRGYGPELAYDALREHERRVRIEAAAAEHARRAA